MAIWILIHILTFLCCPPLLIVTLILHLFSALLTSTLGDLNKLSEKINKYAEKKNKEREEREKRIANGEKNPYPEGSYMNLLKKEIKKVEENIQSKS